MWPELTFGPINLWNAPLMSEKKQKIETYIVTYTCDLCKLGTMIPTGIVLMSNPPKYPHACGICKAEAVLAYRYPKHVYETINE